MSLGPLLRLLLPGCRESPTRGDGVVPGAGAACQQLSLPHLPEALAQFSPPSSACPGFLLAIAGGVLLEAQGSSVLSGPEVCCDVPRFSSFLDQRSQHPTASAISHLHGCLSASNLSSLPNLKGRGFHRKALIPGPSKKASVLQSRPTSPRGPHRPERGRQPAALTSVAPAPAQRPARRGLRMNLE